MNLYKLDGVTSLLVGIFKGGLHVAQSDHADHRLGV